MHVLAHPEPVIDAQPAEDSQHHDLQADAGDDGVVPAVEQLLVVAPRGGGDATADGLDDQARQVGGQEEAWVPLGVEAREGRVEREGDVLERQVDGDADERWAENNGADLELEGVLVPGVVV